MNQPGSGSGFLHEPSGSAFSGPITSGSAEVLLDVAFPLVTTFSGNSCGIECAPL